MTHLFDISDDIIKYIFNMLDTHTQFILRLWRFKTPILSK